MNKYIKYSIIGVLLIGILSFAYNWHNQSIESTRREEIAKLEGEKIVWEKQIIKDHILALKQKKMIDSALLLIHPQDTLIIYRSYDVKKNAVRNLGTDASINFLSTRLK